MKIICMSATAAAALAIAATPAPAQKDHPQTGHSYGYYCQNQSKTHVDGQKGTPFSQCVAAMRKAGASPSTSGKEACGSLSKKHVAGSKGTPYSRCVVGVAQMRSDQEQTSAS